MGSYSNAVSVGVFAGGSIPTGEFADFASTGWHVGGLLEWNSPTAPFGARIDAAYHSFGDADIEDVSPSIVNATINALFKFPTTSTVRPYIIGGGGVYNVRCNGCESQTKLGINGGAGINVPLSGFSTFIEARFHMIFDSDDEAGIANSTFIPISVGIHFR